MLRGSLVGDLLSDAIELSKVSSRGDASAVALLRAVLLYDSFSVTAMTRAREAARRFGIVGLNRALRLLQTAMYGIEIGKDVQLGHGVYFVHSVGTVLGGNSRIGNRVTFMGNNTVGTAKDDGYPVIEDDVVLGAGSRVLGPVRVGARSIIGANAVVLKNVPADSVVIGVPGRVLGKR
jgi:serine O-acetyltransferase